VTLKIETLMKLWKHYADRFRMTVVDGGIDRETRDILLEETRKARREVEALIDYLENMKGCEQ